MGLKSVVVGGAITFALMSYGGAMVGLGRVWAASESGSGSGLVLGLGFPCCSIKDHAILIRLTFVTKYIISPYMSIICLGKKYTMDYTDFHR